MNNRISNVELMNIFGERKFSECSLKNIRDIHKVVNENASTDMQARRKGMSKDKISEVFSDAADELYAYFSSPVKTRDSFDAWHKDLCTRYAKIITEKWEYDIKAGFPQKLINMSFKYFLTFSDAEEYRQYFDFCHMPIDSNIICWYRNNVNNQYPQGDEWQDMTYDRYFAIQTDIREYLSDSSRNTEFMYDSKPLTSLEAEFFVFANSNSDTEGKNMKNITEKTIKKLEEKEQKNTILNNEFYSFIIEYLESSSEYSSYNKKKEIGKNNAKISIYEDESRGFWKIERKDRNFKEAEFGFHFELLWDDNSDIRCCSKAKLEVHFERSDGQSENGYNKSKEFLENNGGITIKDKHEELYSKPIDIDFSDKESSKATIDKITAELSSGEFKRWGDIADRCAEQISR